MYTTKGDLSVGSDSPIGLTDLGRVRVLRALVEHQQLSRSEIVGRSGLARATVSSIVYELISAGLVQESAAVEAAGVRSGRPAQILSLVPDSAFALGLDIAHDHVRAILTDVVGTVRWDDTRQMSVDDHPEQALDTALRLIGAALSDTGVPQEKVLGLGAGFACPVDRDRQRLRAEAIVRVGQGLPVAGPRPKARPCLLGSARRPLHQADSTDRAAVNGPPRPSRSQITAACFPPPPKCIA